MHTIIIVLIDYGSIPVYTELTEVRGGDEPHVIEYKDNIYRLISTGAPDCLWIYERCALTVVGDDK